MEAAHRFDRQARFAPLGDAGQARIEGARVLLVGCGALGGVLAQSLTRAGVGTLVLVDRDVVEVTNLPRQVLFAQGHLGMPKALNATSNGVVRPTLSRMPVLTMSAASSALSTAK